MLLSLPLGPSWPFIDLHVLHEMLFTIAKVDPMNPRNPADPATPRR
jgi:hypothetical protein